LERTLQEHPQTARVAVMMGREALGQGDVAGIAARIAASLIPAAPSPTFDV
jgi:hypothetical protein